MKIKEVMTKKITYVSKNEDLWHVLDLMQKNDYTKIPVMDNHNLVGIVTDNRIADKLGSVKSKGIPASRLHASSVMDKDFSPVKPDDELEVILKTVGEPGLTMLPVLENSEIVGIVTKADLLPLVTSTKNIKEIMNEEIHVVSSEDRVVHARRILLDNDIARMPVIDEGRVTGIIADREIAFAFAEIKRSVPMGRQHHQIRELLVRDVMETPVITGPDTISVKEAADLMVKHEIGGLPIVDKNEKIMGMITRTDIIKQL